jgi:hypothetical protein
MPFVCASSSQVLFAATTQFPCDSPTIEMTTLSASGCPQALIVSQRIEGAAAADYRIVQPAADSVGSLDSVKIAFRPSTSGVRAATLVLGFSNGDSMYIALSGNGKDLNYLSYSTTNDSTEIIGGDIRVPIKLDGLRTANTVEFVVHYDAGVNLEYGGTFAPNNTRIDLPQEQWPGRSKVRLTGPVDTNTPPYSVFMVFVDTEVVSGFRFDSLVITDANNPCAFIVLTQSAVGRLFVTPVVCGSEQISQFLHHRIMPKLSIVPNPAATSVSVRTTISLDADIQIVNALGAVVFRRSSALSPTAPHELDVSALPDGMYSLIVRSDVLRVRIPLVILR